MSNYGNGKNLYKLECVDWIQFTTKYKIKCTDHSKCGMWKSVALFSEHQCDLSKLVLIF